MRLNNIEGGLFALDLVMPRNVKVLRVIVLIFVHAVRMSMAHLGYGVRFMRTIIFNSYNCLLNLDLSVPSFFLCIDLLGVVCK